MNFTQLTLCAAAAVMTACATTAQQCTNCTESVRPVEAFDRIEIDGSFKVIYEKGDPMVVVEAEEKDLPKVVTYVSDGKLVIKSGELLSTNYRVQLKVSSASLCAVNLDGAGSFHTEEQLSGNEVKVELDGAGSIQLNGAKGNIVKYSLDGAGSIKDTGVMEAENVSVEIDGAGTSKVGTIKANKCIIEIDGAAKASAEDITAEYAQMEINGTGKIAANLNDVKVFAAEVNGVGKIALTGKRPEQIRKASVNGVGKVDLNSLTD